MKTFPIFIKEVKSSYPTYEEWKLSIKEKKEVQIQRSYPTYEEWKPAPFSCGVFSPSVLILPMRNGNLL